MLSIDQLTALQTELRLINDSLELLGNITYLSTHVTAMQERQTEIVQEIRDSIKPGKPII